MAITLDGSNGITTPGGATTDDITFADNDKAIFGAGSDLQIYHDGSNSIIKDAGAGNLQINAGSFVVNNAANSANIIVGNDGGAVQLFDNGNAKLATTSTGIDVTGTVTADGINSSGNFAFTAADGMQISAKESVKINIDSDDNDSNRSFSVTSGSPTSLEYLITATEDSGVSLYHDNAIKLATTSTGVTVTQSGTDVGLLVTGGSYNYQAKFESTDAESSIVLEDSNSTNDANRIGVAGNEMRFFANNNQAITIASSGAKNFGAFKSENGGHNIYALAADSGSFAARFDGYGTGASNVVHIVNGYGEVGSIKIASNGTTTNYNTGSDYRLKTDVQPVTNASSRIQELNPVNFEWIRSGTRTDGFLAHEAQAVVPDCVSGAHNEVKVWEDDEELPDGVSVGDNKLDDNGNTIPLYQGIDQSKIVPLLTAALQEALTEIASLKTRVEALEA
jgi:hypothetical protein